MTDRQQKLIDRAVAAFERQFSAQPELLVMAPGRVNIIGEHCDYNDGYVMPMAIDYGTIVAVGASQDNRVHVIADDFDGATDHFDPAAAFEKQADEWKNHVRGSAGVLTGKGYDLRGANLAIAGNVPRGAGLSSSASLGVALAKGFAEFNGITDLNPTDYALIGKQAENEYVGTACGIMDQLVSARAEAGAALLIDCRTLETFPVAMPDGVTVLIIHSGIERELVNSPFNTRREECERAAAHYGVPALRDLNEDRLNAERGDLDDDAFRRARHVVTEIARTEKASQVLPAEDMAMMSELMRQSHHSLRDDFQVTVPPIDNLVASIDEQLGSDGGVRMTGGGFGGCVVALVPDERIDQIEQFIRKTYRTPEGNEPLMFRVVASAGATTL